MPAIAIPDPLPPAITPPRTVIEFLVDQDLEEFGDTGLVARIWHWVLHGGGPGPISHMDWSQFDGEDEELACGNRPRTDAPVTEIDAELKEVTCRACRTQLGIDDNADAAVRLEALFVLSITVGLRPGELRKLTWDLVDMDAAVIHVWRSASRSGEVKTPKSKRSLTLPKRALVALKAHKKRQAAEREAAGEAYHDSNLVFCHEDGTMYTRDALNWRFSKMTRRAGIGHWHAHEGRHTAVSIMSNNGVPIQDIADTVGHKSTHVTETVYRHVIAPAIRGGASVMDDVFGDDDTVADEA
jgi:integrase